MASQRALIMPLSRLQLLILPSLRSYCGFGRRQGANAVALGVGGFLARAGYSADRIFRIVHSICLNRGASREPRSTPEPQPVM